MNKPQGEGATNVPRWAGALSVCQRGRCAFDGLGEQRVVIWLEPDKGRAPCVLLVREKQLISAPGIRALDGTGRELDGRKCAEGERDTPRGEVRVRLDDLTGSRNEHHVNHHAHEEGVNAVAGRDDNRRSFGKRRTPEQPAATACRIECGLDSGGDRVVAACMPKDEPLLRRLKQRSQK